MLSRMLTQVTFPLAAAHFVNQAARTVRRRSSDGRAGAGGGCGARSRAARPLARAICLVRQVPAIAGEAGAESGWGLWRSCGLGCWLRWSGSSLQISHLAVVTGIGVESAIWTFIQRENR